MDPNELEQIQNNQLNNRVQVKLNRGQKQVMVGVMVVCLLMTVMVGLSR